MAIEILLNGRLVGGHPMVSEVVKDDRTGQIKYQKDGKTPRTSTYVGVAIVKPGIVQWRVQGSQTWQTGELKSIFAQEAQEAWKQGQWQHPTFAWKITDGDSTIPNKKGKLPKDREGYPGHLVVNCSTEIGVKCFHVGKYSPVDQIQDKNQIKAGDYCRVLIEIKSNESDQTPGLYVNPTLFELSRAGQQIILGDGPSAVDVFGASAPVLPVNGAYDNSVAPPAAPAPVAPAPVAPAPSAPAMDFLQPPAPPVPAEDSFVFQGKIYTRSQLLSFPGWTEAHLAGLQRSTGQDVPF